MTKAKLLVLGLGLAIVALFAVPAGAQEDDGADITVEPATVEAAGEATFTVTGTGFTAAPPIFVLPCFTVGTLEDLAAAGTTACDTAALTPVTPTDGGFEQEVTYEVPEGGMCIAAGDAATTQTGAVCITVGAAAPAEEATEEPAEGTDDGGEEPLAETGVETTVLLIIGAAVLAAGTMVFSFSRKFTRA